MSRFWFMSPLEPPMLENLRLLRDEKLAAEKRFIAQLLACVDAGYSLARLGRVLDISRQSARSMVRRRVKQ
jgi:hypothetical protein